MPSIREKAQLMSASEIDRTMVRLAQRLARNIEALEGYKVPVGVLDIKLYRDDLSTVGPRPVVNHTEFGFSVVGKDVVLMDDVLYTGRTIRAALDALFELGRPSRVQLLVLIDRGHRELPIEAQYVGRKVPTSSREIIEVKYQEVDGVEKVLLVEKVD
jgi:pyrimidine operon attenuation protein/uracil phosphoribosyltransferase